MEDPLLNRSIEETRELASRWSQFHDFFRMGKSGENLTPQAEMKFLEVKMRVAMLHGGFMQSVQHDQKTAQNLISIMGLCSRLNRIKGMNPNELQKIEYDWNEAYLLISETLSHLEDERDDLLTVSERAYKFERFRKQAFATTSRLVRNPYFMVPAVLVLMIGSVVAIPLLGYYDITQLKRDQPWTQRFYDPTMRAARMIFPEIPFADQHEIKLVNPNFAERDHRARASLFGTAAEAPRELINRGWAEDDVPEVLRNLSRIISFNTKIYVAPGGRQLVAHEILLKSPEDAREAVKLRRDNMDHNLSQEFRFNINANMTVCRRANFVVVLELANSDYREEFAREVYGFRNREIGL